MSKNPLLSSTARGKFFTQRQVRREKGRKQSKDRRRKGHPTPASEFFEVHGREFEPDPSVHPGQAAYIRISSAVILLHIAEDALDGFFSSIIAGTAFGRVTEIFSAFKIIFPYVPRDHLNAVFAMGAFVPHGAGCTDCGIAFVLAVALAVGGNVAQNQVTWAKIAVILLIVNVLIFAEKAILGHGPVVGQRGGAAIVEEALADPGGFVGLVHRNGFDLGEGSGDFVV